MPDTRHKNSRWNCSEQPTLAGAQLAVLMDIRDELQESNRLLREFGGLARCHRIPIALDALHEVGKDIRRKERARRKRNKTRRK